MVLWYYWRIFYKPSSILISQHEWKLIKIDNFLLRNILVKKWEKRYKLLPVLWKFTDKFKYSKHIVHVFFWDSETFLTNLFNAFIYVYFYMYYLTYAEVFSIFFSPIYNERVHYANIVVSQEDLNMSNKCRTRSKTCM